MAGAGVFVGLDRVVKATLGPDSGGGLLAAITLDGIPENLSLGVALIGAGPLQVASLSGSIFLSTCPKPPEYPKAFKEEKYMTGIAAALGLVLAVALDQLG